MNQITNQLVLVINPGSTSTKFAIFNKFQIVLEQTIRHYDSELNQFVAILDQHQYRYQLMIDYLKLKQFDFKNLVAIIARGGLMKPIMSGTYLVNEAMIDDLKTGKYGSHASNLGAMMAHQIAQEYQIPAYIADPVVVDELWPLAKISGLEGVERKSLFHALNQKSVAKKVATQNINKPYERCNFVVAHLGGGISVSAHFQGQVVDTSNALNGDGPFSPERSGSLPPGQFLEWVTRSGHNFESVKRIISSQGGVYSYLKTRDLKALEDKIATNSEIKLILEAMCYQISKEIGAYATVLKGNLDGIILTGGLAHSDFLMTTIRAAIKWIAPIFIVPGENELQALNDAAWAALNQKIAVQVY